MSVVLTDRDTSTYTLTQSASTAAGVTYSVAGGTLADYMSAQARHSNMESLAKNGRHNLQLLRKKINTAGVQRTLQVDLTISVANDGTFAAGDIDDAVVALGSYFNSQASTGAFVLGQSRA